VCKDGLIGGAVFERDENVFIHVENDEARMMNDENATEIGSAFGSSFLHPSFIPISSLLRGG
jgi:hypothetical protein